MKITELRDCFSYWKTTGLRALEDLQIAKQALEENTKQLLRLEQELSRSQYSLEIERTKRIAAESIAAARAEENSRILAESTAIRAEFREFMSIRLKSVDDLNVRLLQPKADEVGDLAKFEAMKTKLQENVTKSVQQRHRELDLALLAKLHPAFEKFKKKEA